MTSGNLNPLNTDTSMYSKLLNQQKNLTFDFIYIRCSLSPILISLFRFDILLILFEYCCPILIIKLIFIIIIVEVFIITHYQLWVIILVIYLLCFNSFLEVLWLWLLRKWREYIFLLYWNLVLLTLDKLLLLNGLLSEKTRDLTRIVTEIKLRWSKLERVALRMLKAELLGVERYHLILTN